MKTKLILYSLLFLSVKMNGQILGGGTFFSNAVTFNSSWLTSCPSGAQTLSNVVGFEPNISIDPCAPAPSATCATGTTASDVWYKFVAQSSTATIVVAPTSAFNIVIQAFSGSTCPGLTDIGCANLLGNNGTETLNLAGLTISQTYYFRIFGLGSNASVRTGQYTFCGSTQLGGILLPLKLKHFQTSIFQKNKVTASWTTVNEENIKWMEIEKSADGNSFESFKKILPKGNGTSSENTYTIIDNTCFNGNNFYRIKFLDNDGQITYSDIKTEVVTNTEKLSLQYSESYINIKISDNPGSYFLKIFDTNGKLIFLKNVTTTSDNTFLKIPVDLKRGSIVFATLGSNNNTLSKKLFVF
jgi:hypothetical protein